MDNKNSVLDYIRYKQLNWYGHVQRMEEERLPWKTKKGKTSKFVDADYNRNEGEGNQQLGVGWQRRVEKENKTLGTKICENINNLYIDKKHICNLFCCHMGS